jgi:transposase-like protein
MYHIDAYEFDAVAKAMNCPVCSSRTVRLERVSDQRVTFKCDNQCVDFSVSKSAGIARIQELVSLALGGARG